MASLVLKKNTMKHLSKLHLFAIVLFTSSSITLQAQYDKLNSITGYQLKVFHSEGKNETAKNMALLTHNAMAYGTKLLNFTPEVTLLVLSPEDWPLYTNFPVYGMPHYANEKTLVVASDDNLFWKSFLPPLDKLPQPLADQIKESYSKDGQLSMQPFFELLALHELGHAFHKQALLNMQRNWMGELFCNIFLHTYIAEKEPARLPALTVFPNMVVAAGNDEYSFTTLEQFEMHYTEIATKHPKNYGWYQSRFHVAAREIYDSGGKQVLVKLWQALRSSVKLDDKKLAEQLKKTVHPSVSNAMLKW